MSSNLRLIIMIWGGAILFYLFVANREGTRVGLGALSNLINSGTKTLQGRA